MQNLKIILHLKYDNKIILFFILFTFGFISIYFGEKMEKKRLYIYEKDLKRSVFEDRWSIDLINEKLFGTKSGFSIGIAEYHLKDFKLFGVHDDQEAVDIISGEGEYKFGDEIFPVYPGCAVYVPPNTKHSVRCTTKQPVRLLYSHGAVGNELSKTKNENNKKRFICEKEAEKTGTKENWGKELINDKNFDTTGGFSLGIAVYTSKEFGKPGIHNDQEAIYILSGQGEYKLGNEIFPISPGCAIFVPPNTEHTIKCITDEPVKLIYTHGAIK